MKNIKKKKVFEIPNRTFAIRSAIKQSRLNEIILIAGKGHEEFQDYGKKKIKISDFGIVKNIKMGGSNYQKVFYWLDLLGPEKLY